MQKSHTSFSSSLNLTNEQVILIIEAARGHPSLKVLCLESNRIGNAGCEALATLLQDPGCNLRSLNLLNNPDIDYEGATNLTNSLSNNTTMKKLSLSQQNEFSLSQQNSFNISYEHDSHLTRLSIGRAILQNGRYNFAATTLRGCQNLKQISITNSNMSDEQVVRIIEAAHEGHSSLEKLDLSINRIGNGGCDALATLLRDPNSNLRRLYLAVNSIGNDGPTSLANSLANNTKLRELLLAHNPLVQSVVDIFSKLICNKTSVNNTCMSNHTLEQITLPGNSYHLSPLLQLNKNTNKSFVAIKKILLNHPNNPNIDMEPLFEWGSDGERSLLALPFVVAWFERANEAITDDQEAGSHRICERKLSSIYQFAKAMPLMFIPPAHTKEKNGTKRKKRDISKRKRDTMGWGEQFYRTYKIKSSKWGQNIGSG